MPIGSRQPTASSVSKWPGWPAKRPRSASSSARVATPHVTSRSVGPASKAGGSEASSAATSRTVQPLSVSKLACPASCSTSFKPQSAKKPRQASRSVTP